jgi:CRISPR/Cas system CMR subunit Cmr4 (Cas7 group RAMP superfamily)
MNKGYWLNMKNNKNIWKNPTKSLCRIKIKLDKKLISKEILWVEERMPFGTQIFLSRIQNISIMEGIGVSEYII